jgi:arylsulfatase A-like enzyme
MAAVRQQMVILVLTAAVAAGCAAPEPPPPPPNIVLVVVDTLRADHLSQYGYPRETSIAIDDFAVASATFRDCAAPAPWTNPSVATLMTGLHTARHLANEFGAVLPDELDTVAEVLRDNGWDTAAISFNPGVRSELNFHQGFEHFDEYVGKAGAYPHMEEMVSRVGAWLENRASGPFFLYLQPMNCHGPYRVPAEAKKRLLGRPPGTQFKYYQEPMQGILRRGELELRDQVSDEYLQSLVDKYDTAVRYSTDQLAELFSLLAAKSLYDDALIIVTADHGEELFDHGGFSHGFSLHRELVHVPLFVKLPGQTDGVVVERRVGLEDVMPTVLEVAGIDADLDLDGRSLVRMATFGDLGHGGEEPTRLSQTSWEGRCIARGATKGNYRLLEIAWNYERLSNVTRLYDVAADPGETLDLAADHPEVARRLLDDLRSRFAEAARLAGPEPVNRKDQLDQERLRALGYVE